MRCARQASRSWRSQRTTAAGSISPRWRASCRAGGSRGGRAEGGGIPGLRGEGGPPVPAAFLEADLVDRLEIFTAPIELGDKGGGEIEGLAATRSEEHTFELQSHSFISY